MNKLFIFPAQIRQIENKFTSTHQPYQVLYLSNRWKILNFAKYNEPFKLNKEYWWAVKDNKLISWSWGREELVI